MATTQIFSVFDEFITMNRITINYTKCMESACALTTTCSKTNNQSLLLTQTLLVMSTVGCCEPAKFEESLLSKAKIVNIRENVIFCTFSGSSFHIKGWTFSFLLFVTLARSTPLSLLHFQCTFSKSESDDEDPSWMMVNDISVHHDFV